MKLYLTKSGHWTGTQADARAAAIAGGDGKQDWDELEVPTDKPGLIAWLNNRNMARAGRVLPAPIMSPDALRAANDMLAGGTGILQDGDRVDPLEFFKPPTPAAGAIAKSEDVAALVDWMLGADVWQLERIFQAIGARFGELKA